MIDDLFDRSAAVPRAFIGALTGHCDFDPY